MTPEHRLMNEMRLWCGEHDLLCFRCNVGSHMMADGRWFDSGLPVGFPDLLILDGNGRAIFCECKVKPNKPSKEQLEFIAEVRRRGFIAGVCYSIGDLEALFEAKI